MESLFIKKMLKDCSNNHEKNDHIFLALKPSDLFNDLQEEIHQNLENCLLKVNLKFQTNFNNCPIRLILLHFFVYFYVLRFFLITMRFILHFVFSFHFKLKIVCDY